MSACLFCRIASHELAVAALHEDELTIAFADINPQAPTHVLVIPKEHFGTAEEAPAELLGQVLATAAAIAGRMLPGGHRMVINTGADGGQTVGHLHVHVLGGRAMGWPPG